MKSQEFRIGNTVYVYTGGNHAEHIHSLEPQDFKALQAMIDAEECKPIPLTEEWLLKFGFERKENNFTDFVYIKQLDKEAFICLEDDFSFCFFDTVVSYDKGEYPAFDFIPKYVHQLQNLYFALTGEELEIKSN